MERRLYYAITWPAALCTTFFGLFLLSYNLGYYLSAGWLHTKLALVILLWGYHMACGHFLKQFAHDKNRRSARFYRIFNEAPTILLIAIVLLVEIKP